MGGWLAGRRSEGGVGFGGAASLCEYIYFGVRCAMIIIDDDDLVGGRSGWRSSML